MHSSVLKQHPVYTLSLLLICLALGLSSFYWADFVQACIAFQITMHRYLVMYMLQQQSGQIKGGVMLVLGGFVYGFLHAVGPGHGKFVITTWLATSKEKGAASRWVTLLGSLMQGVTAIAFVWVLAVIFNLSAGDLSLSRYYVEKGSAVFIAFFGIALLLRAMGLKLSLHRGNRKHRNQAQVDNCGCGHNHLPTVQQLEGDWKTRLWVIFSIGLRPCSGAILILIFANAIGFYRWGVLATMSMAVGTSLSIMLIATLIGHTRNHLLLLNQSWLSRLAGRAYSLSALIAGLLLIFFAFVLFFSVIPVSANGDFIAAGC